MIETNGVSLRTVIAGKGPLVILLHGFPEGWHQWRHQIDPIVAAGFRVAVPDQRGYGGSSKPPAIEDYGLRTLAADVAGIAKALGEDQFIVVGQDWGCAVAWHTALLQAEHCRGVMGLSIPFWRVDETTVNPPGMDEQFWYIRYFQQLGIADAELDADIARSLRTMYYALSADSPAGSWIGQLQHPRTSRFLDALPEPGIFSGWFSEEDFAYAVRQFGEDGFRAPLNWYRNIATPIPELDNARFRQPAAFLAGADDDALLYDPDWRENLPKDFDDLRFIEVIENCGHWLHAEKPAETTKQLLRFLNDIR